MNTFVIYLSLGVVALAWGGVLHRTPNLNSQMLLSRHRRQNDNYNNNYYQQQQEQQQQYEQQQQQYEQDRQNQYDQQNQQYEQENQNQQYEQEQQNQQYEQEQQNQQYEQENQNQQYEQEQQNQQYEQEQQNQQNDQDQQQQNDDRGGQDDRQKRSIRHHTSNKYHTLYSSNNPTTVPLSGQSYPDYTTTQTVGEPTVPVATVNFSLCKYLLEVIIGLLRDQKESDETMTAVPVEISDASKASIRTDNEVTYKLLPVNEPVNLQFYTNNVDKHNDLTFDDETDLTNDMLMT